MLTDDLKQKLYDTETLIKEIGESLDLPKMEAELKDLTAQQEQPGFFNDMKKVESVGKRAAYLSNSVANFKRIDSAARDIGGLIELCEAEDDEHALNDVRAELKTLSEEVEKLHLNTLLSGEYDHCNAILTVHSGAGGTESCDWADMLYRMYTRWCERNGYKVRVLDFQEGDGAGLKSVTFNVEGDNAYGYLKAEKGVHRLVRISPFDANKRRHTSFASLEVMPEIEDDVEIEIRPEDIKVDTFRSSGAGGQHVNKTESAIRITHIPSGIIVACQNERSQVQNRETAMKMLKGKLIEIKERENMERAAGLKGEIKKIEWGSQIRSYVFCPYTLAKDHRTGFENPNITAVMDGDIDGFIFEYLKKSR